jgi:CheY-like chemotaxis protein
VDLGKKQGKSPFLDAYWLGRPVDGPVAEPGDEGAVIVVAEDHEDIRYVLKRSLERAGHRVVAAADGAAALAAVREHRPDLVVTDVDMPHMTGLDLCRAIRADDELRHIPVVVASGSLLPGDGRAEQAGASATLLKPFVPAQLLDVIASLLPRPAQAPGA